MNSKKLIVALWVLVAATMGVACSTDTDDGSAISLRSTGLTVSVPRPTANTPIDVYLQPGQALAFGGHYFTLAAPGELPPPKPTTKAKVAQPGDVVAIQHAGTTKRFVTVAVDTKGGLVAVPQGNVGFTVQSAFEAIPDGWLPNPGAMMQCQIEANEEMQECVSISGSYGCCIGYMAQAVAMCNTNIWGHSIADDQGSIWAALCGGGGGSGGGGDAGDAGDDGGGTDCGDDWEFVEDVPVEVNGENCRYTGWTHSSTDPETGDCVTIADITLGDVVCADPPNGGTLPPPGQTQPA